MIPKNFWQADQLRKLVTVGDVDRQIARCEMGHAAATSEAQAREWLVKLGFLARLKEHRVTDGLPPIELNAKPK